MTWEWSHSPEAYRDAEITRSGLAIKAREAA